MENIDRNNQLLLTSQSSNCGSIDACKKCSGLECCGIVSEGGVIEPPYLTIYDIRQIEHYTGLKKEQFAVKRKNPVTGNVVSFLNTIENEGCIFFDRKKGKCTIHSFRPIDCRLFPLDLRAFPSDTNTVPNYFWALFKFKRCSLNKKDISSLLKYKEVIKTILEEEIHDFATYPLPEMEKIGFQKLLKLNLDT
jgi:Fe-S-cluster containining protein